MTQNEFVTRCAKQVSASLIKEGYGDLDRKWSDLPGAIYKAGKDIANGVDKAPSPRVAGRSVGDYVKDNFGKDKGYGLKKFGRQIKRGAQLAAATPALAASVAVGSGVKAAKDFAASASEKATAAYGSARGALKRFIGEDTTHGGIPTEYTHFAIRKADNKIVNGWDYSDKDSSELKQYMKDYFGQDLEDMGLDVRKFKIFTVRGCKSAGINPFDEGAWDNIQPEDCM